MRYLICILLLLPCLAIAEMTEEEMKEVRTAEEALICARDSLVVRLIPRLKEANARVQAIRDDQDKKDKAIEIYGLISDRSLADLTDLHNKLKTAVSWVETNIGTAAYNLQ